MDRLNARLSFLRLEPMILRMRRATDWRPLTSNDAAALTFFLAVCSLVVLLTACDSAPGQKQPVRTTTPATNLSAPSSNSLVRLTALDSMIAPTLSAEFGTMVTLLTNAGRRLFHITNSTFNATNWQPLLQLPPLRFNEAPFKPPEPADYADPDALHRFIERAKSRRVDTFYSR